MYLVTCYLELRIGSGDVLNPPQTTFLPSVVMCTFQCTKWQLGPATAPGTYRYVCTLTSKGDSLIQPTIVCNHLCESVCVCVRVLLQRSRTLKRRLAYSPERAVSLPRVVAPTSATAG